MDRLLIDYLPQVVREVREFKVLMAAQQPVVETIWAAHDDVLENQFLLSATAYGISRWERILGIFPKDTDGLEMRRARVLSILRIRLPYTVRWLRRWLTDLCGEGNFLLEVYPYTISLDLGLDNIPEAEHLVTDLMALLQVAKPANMVLNFNSMRQSTGSVLVGGISEMAATVEVWPARSVLESTGGVQMAGFTEYVVTVETYPAT